MATTSSDKLKAANFVWKRGGPKPVSKKNLQETTWMIRSTVVTPNNLEVNFKAGSREFGLASDYKENKLSELSLKKNMRKFFCPCFGFQIF